MILCVYARSLLPYHMISSFLPLCSTFSKCLRRLCANQNLKSGFNRWKLKKAHFILFIVSIPWQYGLNELIGFGRSENCIVFHYLLWNGFCGRFLLITNHFIECTWCFFPLIPMQVRSPCSLQNLLELSGKVAMTLYYRVK